MKVHITLLFMAGLMVGCSESAPEAPKSKTAWVNPFVGTGGHGHTFPGAIVPHGMIQPSPDTRVHGWDACSGYHYSDSTINGFSHTHLSGTGCADYGDVLIMPTTGPQDIRYLGKKAQRLSFASPFSHEKESARPGYYQVYLDRYDVNAEITATERAAIHRYTFPENSQSGFILDLDYSIQGQHNKDMFIEVLSPTKIRGHKKTASWAYNQHINFYVEFSKPFTSEIIQDTIEYGKNPVIISKALLQFATADQEEVLMKIGISSVDLAGAQKNLEKEIPHWDFDLIAAHADDKWEQYLSKIDIETSNEDQKKIFYTSMYHTGIQPTIFTDVDGRYRGMDTHVYDSQQDSPAYTVFSLWDTFRAYHPLMTILDPEMNEAFVRSLLTKADQGGVLPMWELAGNYTGTMIGYHAVSVIVDSYMKGYKNFDVKKAYDLCLHSSRYDTVGIHSTRYVRNQLMPQAKYWKNKIGYIPCDKDTESVAKALEYAYNDWCIATFAKELGQNDDYEEYSKFAKAYQTYFDKSTRFMRGVDSQGNWREPFHPRSSNHRQDDYCEGTAWQWTWFVPHDVDGLVDLMGGKEPFISKLDSLFTADSSLEGDLVSADITGLIGQYAHGNEPSHHIAHLYNYVDQPWKTQALVDSVLHTLYFNDPNGLSGNEDCGQMSAWYILNSMGFYQVCPGNPTYSIGRPLFDRVAIDLPNGSEFVVVANNNSKENKYIQSMRLNGKTLDEPFFTHSDLAQGGILEIEMGNTPK